MNKRDLEQYLISDFGIPRATARKILSGIYDKMQTSLIQGEKVLINGVGSIEVRKRPRGQKNGFGETYLVEEKLRLKFKPSDILEEKINDREAVETKSSMTKLLLAISKEDK